MAVSSEEPAAPRRIDPTIHPDLETITVRCRNKQPRHRYANAAQVAAELSKSKNTAAGRGRWRGCRRSIAVAREVA